MTTSLDPKPILDVGFGFWSSKVLLTAVELGVFTVLGEAPLHAATSSATRSASTRAASTTSSTRSSRCGFLERDGDGAERALLATPRDRRTSSTAQARATSAASSRCSNARLFRFWGDLAEALRTGKPQNEIKHTGTPMFEELYSDLPRLEQFMGAMSGISRSNFEALAEKFDFSPLPDAVRRRRRHRRCSRASSRRAPPAPALHVVRPAGRRADREARDRRRRARRPRDDGLGRLLQATRCPRRT